MNAWEEDKFWKADEEANRPEVERIRPAILEEGDTESVSVKSLPGGFAAQGDRRFREICESVGARVIFQDIRIPTNGFRRMLNLEGVNDIMMGDLVGVVSGDLLEIGNASEKKVSCKW